MFETVKTIAYLVRTFFGSFSVTRKAEKKPEKEMWQDGYLYLRQSCPGLLKAAGARVIYHGLENLPEEPGYLLVGNHQSDFDIIALMSVMEHPTAFVSKKELDHVPLIGRMLRTIGCIPINRKNLLQSVEAIKEASKRISRGLNMVIFPEGTRSKGPKMGEFKKGALRAAFDAKAPIVPFRIENMYAVYEGNKGIRVKPAEAHIYFGDPIPTAELDRGGQKQLAGQIQQIVAELN